MALEARNPPPGALGSLGSLGHMWAVLPQAPAQDLRGADLRGQDAIRNTMQAA